MGKWWLSDGSFNVGDLSGKGRVELGGKMKEMEGNYSKRREGEFYDGAEELKSKRSMLILFERYC